MIEIILWVLLGCVILVDLFVVIFYRPVMDDRWWKCLGGTFSNGGKSKP